MDNFVDEVCSDEESDDPLSEDICQLLEDSKDPASKGLKLTKDLKEDVEKVTFSDNNIPETQGLLKLKIKGNCNMITFLHLSFMLSIY